MTSISIKAVPFHYSIKWFTSSWALAKKHYWFALGMQFVIFVINLSLSRIPLVGGMASAVVTYLLFYGQLTIVKKMLANQSFEFADLFMAFSNKELVIKSIPLLAIVASLGIPAIFAQQFMEFYIHDLQMMMLITGGIVFYSLFVAGLVVFSAPLILIKNLNFTQTIGPNIKASLINFLPMAAASVIAVVLVTLSIMMLFIPFIFVVLPLTFPIITIVYETIFEGLELGNTV